MKPTMPKDAAISNGYVNSEDTDTYIRTKIMQIYTQTYSAIK